MKMPFVINSLGIKSFSLLETDWQLFITGDGKEKENLQSLIEKLNLKD